MISPPMRLLRLTIPCAAVILLTSCGGGSGGVVTYQVSATAGSGGSISPSSASVNAGGATQFTLTPNSGYGISGATGCGGTLSGSTYITGPVNAACTVTASFAVQYTVTATAGAGGTISPASVPVLIGATTQLTLAPKSGYAVSSVTGCGGTLSGITYTTAAASADCAVTATFSAAFTWIGGSDTVNAKGIYGTRGVAAATNMPGARSSGATRADGSGNVWLLGGYGYDSAGTETFLNDLWKYSSTSGEWTWVTGNSTGGPRGSYGTRGQASNANEPGGRSGAVTWLDASGNLWLFGGYGFDSTGTGGPLNDLWEYSPSSGDWIWVGGATTWGATGVYGTEGQPAAANIPGARSGAVGWADANGNLWLFGGAGYDSAGQTPTLNDLWEYSPSSGEWTWVSGSSSSPIPKGVYGTQGVAAATNVPGGRSAAVGWADASGDLWLFGGQGYDATGTSINYLNDLWEYSPSSGEWTWVSGSSSAGAKGVYGTQGVAAAGNVPGARNQAVSWIDGAGHLWLFGGYGFDSTGVGAGDMNDLWEYSPSGGEWTWVANATALGAAGVYGTEGQAAITNVPGARADSVGWVDAGGNLWLFGGAGYDSAGNSGVLNDLWKYPTQ